MDTDRAGLLTRPSAVVTTLADELLERRLKGEPLAYILGYREFFSRRFAVDPSVLIPRQETETLVDAALEMAPLRGRVLDVGTGSGCIAITLKLERPDLEVVAVDISEEALAMAKGNAIDLGAGVVFFQSNLFENVEGVFDLIVSNPPYIAENAELPREIRDHEPSQALFAGPDGLAVYQRLAEGVAPLVKDGVMILELGDEMAAVVQSSFEQFGWRVLETRPDLGGNT